MLCAAALASRTRSECAFAAQKREVAMNTLGELKRGLLVEKNDAVCMLARSVNDTNIFQCCADAFAAFGSSDKKHTHTKKAHLSVSLFRCAYGAAPRVESTDNYWLSNVILGVLHSFYPKVYPED